MAQLTFGEPRWLTPEDLALMEEEARQERLDQDRRWPLSQRRPRCPFCGCFVKVNAYWTKNYFPTVNCARCGGGRID